MLDCMPAKVLDTPRRLAGRIRSTIDMAWRPYDGLESLYRRHGPICTVGAGPFRYVFLLGPEANRFVFGNSQLFRWREAFETLVPVDGETALLVSDGEDHIRRRRLVVPALHARHFAGYAASIRRNVDYAIDSWRPGAELNVYLELRRVIRLNTIEVLFGRRLAADSDELGRQLQLALDFVDQAPALQHLQRLGLQSWRRAKAARAAVASRVREEIGQRRREPLGSRGQDADASLG